MHKIGAFIWFIVRAAVSVVALVGGTFLLFTSIYEDGLATSGNLQIVGFSCLFATLPWVFDLKRKPKRVVGILVAAMGICFIGFGLFDQYSPEDCTRFLGRREGGCVLFNALYSIGGPPLVASLYILLGFVFLLFCYRFFRQKPYA